MQRLFAVFLLLFLFCTIKINGQNKTQIDSLISDMTIACKDAVGSDARFICAYPARIPATAKNAKAARYYVQLQRGTTYRFLICSDERYGEAAVLTLNYKKQLLASTFKKSENIDNKYFEFTCKKSGKYELLISPLKGVALQAVGIMAVVNN